MRHEMTLLTLHHCSPLQRHYSSLPFHHPHDHSPSFPPLLHARRDTIHIEGVKLGFDRPVFFDRHAVGGEYGAGWKSVGAGRLVTTFFGDVSSVVWSGVVEWSGVEWSGVQCSSVKWSAVYCFVFHCGTVLCNQMRTCLSSRRIRTLDIILFFV
jgi:hypothetical protein